MKNLWIGMLCILIFACSEGTQEKVKSHPDLQPFNLVFDYLPISWDEGLPLGNGQIGTLVWQKEGKIRFSLDQVELWDLRKMKNLEGDQFSFSWVKEQWENGTYKNVQDLFDVPYDTAPAPSKIPGAALEFDTLGLGEVVKSVLDLESASVVVEWKSGVKLNTFVHAEEPVSWFRFEGVDPEKFSPELILPTYHLEGKSEAENPVTGQDLRRLGYPEGKLEKTENGFLYTQKGWENFEYQVSVRWEKTASGIQGCWAITTNLEAGKSAPEITSEAMNSGIEKAIPTHQSWWNSFWNQSSLTIPDTVLMKQWYLEQYKFGSAARENTPPISLQAVWTADNGKLPPWKGDFHHDLNTQLSYWPSYSANHLDLAKGYLNWLNKHKPNFKSYTETYFGTKGINVPGVTTLTGEPMGGWIQYAFGPSVSGWLAQHFYFQWKYSMDREFLEKEAYPWFQEVGLYFEEISELGTDGKRKLPISASPEIHNNSAEAWFPETTNFDLAIIRFVYAKSAELALELGKEEEAKRYSQLLEEWPDYAVDSTGLTMAPGEPLTGSHRHFSHLMAIHPLSLINWSDGPKAQETIRNTVNHLKTTGSSAWVGYSFSWLGNLQARMFDGEGAAETLKIFAENFCLPNSFHVNGDQSGKGFSNFTYRPFTLEGNFAFASGLQEMLLQSHEGFIRIFPAIPDHWENASFDRFLAQGAFEISAEKMGKREVIVLISAPKGGELKILNPLGVSCLVNGDELGSEDFWIKEMKVGEEISLRFQAK